MYHCAAQPIRWLLTSILDFQYKASYQYLHGYCTYCSDIENPVLRTLCAWDRRLGSATLMSDFDEHRLFGTMLVQAVITLETATAALHSLIQRQPRALWDPSIYKDGFVGPSQPSTRICTVPLKSRVRYALVQKRHSFRRHNIRGRAVGGEPFIHQHTGGLDGRQPDLKATAKKTTAPLMPREELIPIKKVDCITRTRKGCGIQTYASICVLSQGQTEES